MKRALLFLGLMTVLGCSSHTGMIAANDGKGDTRTKEVQFLDDHTFLLTEMAIDKTYGYEISNPVKVGGVHDSSGPLNQRRYLNALLGPNGEELVYSREGSCCSFKTPNGHFNNMGLLDIYRVSWTGSKDTLNIYINMYDKGDLKIPVGMTAKKQHEK